MRRTGLGRTAGLVGVAVVTTLVVQSALAAPTTGTGDHFKQVKIVSDPASTTKTTTTFSTIPGSQTTITTTPETNTLVLARLTGTSACSGVGSCNVRILIGGVAGAPGAATFAIGGGGGPTSSRSYEAWRVVGGGTFTVAAQWRVTDAGGMTFQFQQRTLVVERIDQA